MSESKVFSCLAQPYSSLLSHWIFYHIKTVLSLSLFCTPFSDLTRAKVATASIHGMDFFSIPVSQWNRARGRTGHVTILHTLTDTAYSCWYCLFFLKISDSNLSWKFNLSLVAVFALKIVMFMVWNSYGVDIRKWIKSGLVLEFRPAPFRGVGKIVERGGGRGGGIALCTRFLSTWTIRFVYSWIKTKNHSTEGFRVLQDLPLPPSWIYLCCYFQGLDRKTLYQAWGINKANR